MKCDLILVTRQFPYGNKETFIESEIKILCKYFNTITIYPSTRHEIIRSLPSNVVVDDLICNDYTSKLKWIPRTIFTIDFIIYAMRYLIKAKSICQLVSYLKYIVSFAIYKNKIQDIVKKNSAHLFYSYWYSPFVDAFCSLKPKGRKIVTRVHGGDLYEEITVIGFFPNRNRFINDVDEIFSISNFGFDYIKKRYQNSRISLSRLGIIDNGELAIQSEIGFLSIVSVSDIIPLKNLAQIAKSIFLFSLRNPTMKISWNHFGDGDGRLELENIILQEKPQNLFCKLQGVVKNRDILKYYASSPVDVFINLSESEGIPVSMMEAISFGIPIIATNVGGVSEIVNNTTGILISRPVDISDVAQQIENLYKFPMNRKHIKQFFKANFSAVHNYSKFAEKLVDLSIRQD